MAEAVSTCLAFVAGLEGGSMLREKIPGAGETESHRAAPQLDVTYSSIPLEEPLASTRSHSMGFVGSAGFLIVIFFPPFPLFFLIRAFVLSPAHAELPELQARLQLPHKDKSSRKSRDSLSLQSRGARISGPLLSLVENTGIFLPWLTICIALQGQLSRGTAGPRAQLPFLKAFQGRVFKEAEMTPCSPDSRVEFVKCGYLWCKEKEGAATSAQRKGEGKK